MESYVFKKIELREISDEFPYGLRYRLEDPRLLESIRARGVLTPVVVTAGVKKTMVAGHRRFQAALILGLAETKAFEIQGSPSPQDLFLASVISNWNQSWSDLDRAWTLRKALETFRLAETEILEAVLPALALASAWGLVKEYHRVAGLDPLLLDLIAEDKLPFKGARRLAVFSSEDQQEFARGIAVRAALTASQLAKAAEWLYDLLQSSKLSLKTYLAKSSLEDLLAHPDSSRQVKGERFYAALRALRFPQLAARERKFASFVRELERESQELTLEPPVSFEEEGYWLRAKIRTPDSLKRVLDVLGRKRASLNSLFDIML